MNAYSNFMNTEAMQDALRASSVSAEDARLRGNEYAKMFSRNEELHDVFGLGNNPTLLQKTFSGYAETPLLSTQYFNASVASYVSSFAGFMSVEKDFNQPNGLFYWFDVLGVTDLRPVIPNLGPDELNDVNVMGHFTHVIDLGTTESYTEILAKKIVPGTVRIKINSKQSDGTFKKLEISDNGQGNFVALPGVLGGGVDDNSINYLSGAVKFKLSAALLTGSTIELVGREDVTGVPCGTEGANTANASNKRFLAKMQQIGLQTVPDMLVAEYNIAALGAMKKATGSDMATFLFSRLREIYTKTINKKLVDSLEDGYTGNVLDINLAAQDTSFYDYRSRVDLFDAYLTNVETALARKAVKGVTATAYVAGANACNQFQKGRIIGKFEKNTKMTYINDLLGWYDGIPVLRSTEISEGDNSEGVFFAIHKTADGQMAPLARGIYMPLTDTPTIGNYNNPTQMASGIYYQEGVRYMAPELVQKVVITQMAL